MNHPQVQNEGFRPKLGDFAGYIAGCYQRSTMQTIPNTDDNWARHCNPVNSLPSKCLLWLWFKSIFEYYSNITYIYMCVCWWLLMYLMCIYLKKLSDLSVLSPSHRPTSRIILVPEGTHSSCVIGLFGLCVKVSLALLFLPPQKKTGWGPFSFGYIYSTLWSMSMVPWYQTKHD